MPRKKAPPKEITTRPITHNSIVAKHNDLLDQIAKFGLSELRLIAFCLAHYDSRKEDNRCFKARVEDLTETFPTLHRKFAYDVVRRTMLNLGKKPLEFKEGSKRHYWNWFSGFTYDEGNGEFEFSITPEIRPHLVKLEGSFTKYRLRDVYQFRSASTWKLYELLARWRVGGRWAVDLDELRLLLGVAGKYPRWDNLKNRLIDPSLEEINESSDIRATYQPTKRGRQITGLVFFVEAKKKGDEDLAGDEESNDDKLTKALLAAGITAKAVAGLVAEAKKADKVEALIKAVPKMATRATAKGLNIARYVTGAVKKEIHCPPLPFGDPREIALACRRKHLTNRTSCTPKKTAACGICHTLE